MRRIACRFELSHRIMAIRYLRRPPKPVERKTKRGAGKSPPQVLPQERAAMAKDLVYFCVVCGREHVSGGVRESDICSAQSQIDAVIKHTRP
jgi:ribosomal protein L44E